MSRLHVGFDGIAFPLEKNVVAIEAEEGPVEGAGIAWEVIDEKIVVTVEFKTRGGEPIHIALCEDDDGDFEIITPPICLKRPEPEQA